MPRSRTPRFSLARLRPGPRALRRNAVALILALLTAALASYFQVSQSNALYQGGPLYALESAAQDLALRLRDPASYGSALGRDPREIITIVAMDERSLAQLGHWSSWPRAYYGQVVDTLLTAPPRVIAFDVGFFESKPDDAELAAAFQRARSRRPATAIVLASAGGGRGERGPGFVQFLEGLHPIPVLADNADIASANVVPDDLGVVRSMPLLAHHGEAERSTLGLAAVAKYLRRPTTGVDSRPEPTTIVFSGREIPVDRSGLVKINFFGAPSKPNAPEATFRVVSFVDVLQGRADPQLWNNGLVLVGLLDATGFADDYWTPVSTQGGKMAGVEIHANLAATLFSTQFLREAPLASQVAIVVVIALLIGLVAANLGIVAATATSLLVLALYSIASLTTLSALGLQLPLSFPLVAGVVGYASVTAYRVIVEQRQARALQGALASVIPPSVAQEIARDPDRVRMGGERRAISVLFTDLKGFTTFSESVDPEVLARVITEYLNAMTAVIFRYGGTVDKFIGDAVMAFWNAPLDDPDHAVHACEAALDMQAALRELGDRWEAQGLPRQLMRIGVNTGPASVGNMGTSQRFAYTALGDTVNLGARLEPLNNEYGTWICISQSTLEAAGGPDRFLVRFLDLVAVKGKKEPVPVYELIGRAGEHALAARYKPVLESYERGMELYRARRFGEAAEIFRLAARAGGNGVDSPSAVYIERCEHLAQDPPEADWDGVFVMKHK